MMARVMILRVSKNMNETGWRPWALATIISKGEEGQKMFLQTYV
jgi:hypothetical protein